MTTRAEEIAGEGPYTVRYDNGRYVLDGPTPTVGFWALEEWDAQNHADDLNAAYLSGKTSCETEKCVHCGRLRSLPDEPNP